MSTAWGTATFFFEEVETTVGKKKFAVAKKKVAVAKKDFTPLCSKGVKFFFATATSFFATAIFFLPTVFSTSSKKKVAAPQAVLIVPTLQWSQCFAGKYRNGAIAIQFEPWQV